VNSSAARSIIEKTARRIAAGRFPSPRQLSLFIFAFAICGWSVAAQAQSAAPASSPGVVSAGVDGQQTLATPTPQNTESVSGTVVDSTGAAVVRAHLTLTRDDSSAEREITADGNGQFTFTNVGIGPYHLLIAADGFASQTYSGTLAAGEAGVVPQITLAVASEATQVQVTVSRVELAEDEIKIQEKQRVLGVFPNFYVSYDPDAVPLTSKQKFELAWRTSIDPVTFVLTGAVAGVQQWQNNFSGYGQGAQGYGKRYGAVYADNLTSTFLGGAIFPSLFKQDPRYFYKGTGTVRSRFFYAVANAVICKGDNRKWQPAYSTILGDLASGGISNAYYPNSDRGAALAFENTLIGIGTTAAANVLQEFLIRKLTPGQNHNLTQP
jgi:hypothetical protein